MKVFVAVVGGHPTRVRERSRTSPWREGGGGPRAGRCEEGPGVSGWSAGRSERCWAGGDLARESGWPLRQGLSRSLVWWGAPVPARVCGWVRSGGGVGLE